jgi:hypothetical protein
MQSYVLLAAAALAVWVDARAPTLRPVSIGRGLARTAVAVGSFYAVGIVVADVGDVLTVVGRFVMLFGGVLPTLTFVFLSGVWVLRALAEGQSFGRR